MRRLPLILTALTLVNTMALPPVVAAQDYFDEEKRMRVAAVVGVGVTQQLNLHYLDGRPAAGDPSEPGIPGVTIVLQDANPPIYEAVCSQTIHALGHASTGLLNTLSLGITSEEEGRNKQLLVNGVVQDPPLGDCFDGTERIVYIVGEISYVEPDFPTPQSSTPPVGHGGIMIYDVTDPSGATAVTVGLDLPQKFVIFENRD